MAELISLLGVSQDLIIFYCICYVLGKLCDFCKAICIAEYIKDETDKTKLEILNKIV